MSDERVNITIIHSDTRTPLEVARAVAALLMACRRCGATMERGTQCQRCRAWCR